MQTEYTIIDDRYEVLSRLGTGGFATVLKARQIQFGRLVALKLIKPDVALDEDSLARFEREARILSTLKHRNLPVFYGFGHWNGMTYLATEFIDGKPLLSFIEEHGHMDFRTTLSVMKQLCSALACAHANGVIHRDVSAANVLLSETQEVTDYKLASVKVIDFGLAKDLYATAAQKLTEAGVAIGSVHYMSPEQCVGGFVDARSDIYSVGCLLYHCITGTPPFNGEHSVVVMTQHCELTMPRLVDKFGELNEEQITALQIVIDQATAKDPSNRFSSMKELEDALTTLLSDKGCTITEEPAEEVSEQVPRLKPKSKQKFGPNKLKQFLIPIMYTACSCLLLLSVGVWVTTHTQQYNTAEHEYTPMEMKRMLKAAGEFHKRNEYKRSLSTELQLLPQVKELSLTNQQYLLEWLGDDLVANQQFGSAVKIYQQCIDLYPPNSAKQALLQGRLDGIRALLRSPRDYHKN